MSLRRNGKHKRVSLDGYRNLFRVSKAGMSYDGKDQQHHYDTAMLGISEECETNLFLTIRVVGGRWWCFNFRPDPIDVWSQARLVPWKSTNIIMEGTFLKAAWFTENNDAGSCLGSRNWRNLLGPPWGPFVAQQNNARLQSRQCLRWSGSNSGSVEWTIFSICTVIQIFVLIMSFMSYECLNGNLAQKKPLNL